MTISPPPRPPSRPRAAPASGLNPAQAEAVNAPAAPLLVLAGAGTGKTRVVIARIINLVKRGTPPDRILAVTFTNKAAREMVARIGNRFGKRPRTPAGGEQQPAPPKPEVSTIHSL
ncbi:MAG: ATP-dependent DNA helicase Rep, partial [Planctomycetia bacterium]|nr:ATP-dependent DNA helicase Rep [Planctomycetia bacterium]